MEHIRSPRIFELSQLEPPDNGAQMTDWEKEHLRQCEECQRILAILARAFDKYRPPNDRPA